VYVCWQTASKGNTGYLLWKNFDELFSTVFLFSSVLFSAVSFLPCMLVSLAANTGLEQPRKKHTKHINTLIYTAIKPSPIAVRLSIDAWFKVDEILVRSGMCYTGK